MGGANPEKTATVFYLTPTEGKGPAKTRPGGSAERGWCWGFQRRTEIEQRKKEEAKHTSGGRRAARGQQVLESRGLDGKGQCHSKETRREGC